MATIIGHKPIHKQEKKGQNQFDIIFEISGKEKKYKTRYMPSAAQLPNQRSQLKNITKLKLNKKSTKLCSN